MLKRLLNWLMGKDASVKVTPSVATNGHRAATMIAEAKPIIRPAEPVAAPVAGGTEGTAVIGGSTGGATVASRGATTHTRTPEQHEIALRAHQIWLERGGESTANWLQAERELTERLNRR